MSLLLLALALTAAVVEWRTPVREEQRAVGGDLAWGQAWASGDAEVVRQWFELNTGPSEPVTGTAAGGEIRTQAQADLLIGTTVISRLRVACDCVLQEFVLLGADMWITGGRVTVRNVTLDGWDTPSLVGGLNVQGGAEVSLSRVQIRGHHDGIRSYGRSVTARYVYVHDVSDRNPNDLHADGIQAIGGVTAVERSFIDMVGDTTSAVLIKPDAGPIAEARVNESVLMGGGYTLHVHPGPHGTPQHVDLSGNLVAPGYRDGLVSTWGLEDGGAGVPPTTAVVSGTGTEVLLEDGAEL